MKTLIALALIVLAAVAQDPHAAITFATGALVILAISDRPNPPRPA